MAAPTIRYISEGDSAGSANGTSWANRYGGLQTAIDAETTAGTGFRFKVYSVSTTLTAAINPAGGYTPVTASPIIIEGVNSDGTAPAVATYDGNALYSFIASTTIDHVHLYNLHLTNFGSNIGVQLNDKASIVNCEIDNGTSDGIDCDFECQVINCYLHNLGARAIAIETGLVYKCRIEDGTNTCTNGIACQGAPLTILFNTIWLNSITGRGVNYKSSFVAIGNSIYNNAIGTAEGFRPNASTEANCVFANNCIEGFDGTGGNAIEIITAGYATYVDGNAFYDNTNNLPSGHADKIVFGDTDNESLGASPFTDAANKDFRPVDTGNVKEGSLPGGVGLF